MANLLQKEHCVTHRVGYLYVQNAPIVGKERAEDWAIFQGQKYENKRIPKIVRFEEQRNGKVDIVLLGFIPKAQSDFFDPGKSDGRGPMV